MTVTEPIEPIEPEGEAPEAPEFTLPEDFAAQVQGWDVPVEKIPEAVELFKALQTEEGTIDGFIRLGQNLGFGIKELERLFAEETPVTAPTAATPAAPAEPAFDEDPDRLMSAAEVRQLLDAERAAVDGRFQETQQQEQQRRAANAHGTISAWFAQQGIADDEAQNAIARFGDKTILPGNDSFDPAVIIPALERGKAEYDAWVEREAQSYLARKAGTATAQPTALGGQVVAGEEEAPAPDYVELRGNALSAAKQRVRDRLRAAGQEF